MKHLIVNATTAERIETTLTDEEISLLNQLELAGSWNALRAERNRRLAECDWTVLSDTPTSTAAWKVYRQALRDLPANTTDPFNPVWPTPPA